MALMDYLDRISAKWFLYSLQKIEVNSNQCKSQLSKYYANWYNISFPCTSSINSHMAWSSFYICKESISAGCPRKKGPDRFCAIFPYVHRFSSFLTQSIQIRILQGLYWVSNHFRGINKTRDIKIRTPRT